jgi:hypothetical protein
MRIWIPLLDPDLCLFTVQTDPQELGFVFLEVNNEHLAERVPVPGDERVLQPHPRLPSEGCRR